MSAFHEHGRVAPPIREAELCYVLVADGDRERSAACLEAVKPFKIGALVARDGDAAARVLERFGPPTLLLADLSLPGEEMLSLADAVRRAARPPAGIVVWSASRELQQLAIHRLGDDHVRVFGGTVPASVLRDAIEKVLRSIPSDEDVRAAASNLPAAPAALLDRRNGLSAIACELARVRRERQPLSVVLLDVDALDVASAIDDAIVAAVNRTLIKVVRESDLAIQWGPGALLVVLPGLTEPEARQVAERVRAGLEGGSGHRLAVSGGVAELLADETFESVLAKAVEKVRLARERGRNRIG